MNAATLERTAQEDAIGPHGPTAPTLPIHDRAGFIASNWHNQDYVDRETVSWIASRFARGTAEYREAMVRVSAARSTAKDGYAYTEAVHSILYGGL